MLISECTDVDKLIGEIMTGLNNVCNTGHILLDSDYEATENRLKRIKELYHRTEISEKDNGEWIPSHPVISAKQWKCTACQEIVDLPVFVNECYYNYCPNCGSKNR